MIPAFVGRDRLQHAERQASLEVLRMALSQNMETIAYAGGVVRMHSCHTPCASCLCVLCQVRRLLPSVLFQVSYDSWLSECMWTSGALHYSRQEVIELLSDGG